MSKDKKDEEKWERRCVEIVSISNTNPYVNEWWIYEVVSQKSNFDELRARNLVKVLQPILEHLVNGQQGPMKRKALGQFEFYSNEFFSDDILFTVPRFMVSRELSEDESLYAGYENILKARRKQIIENEARQKMQAVDGPTTEVSQ